MFSESLFSRANTFRNCVTAFHRVQDIRVGRRSTTGKCIFYINNIGVKRIISLSNAEEIASV